MHEPSEAIRGGISVQVGSDSVYMMHEKSNIRNNEENFVKYSDFSTGVVATVKADPLTMTASFSFVNFQDKFLFAIGGRPRTLKTYEVLSSVDKYNIK